jgi:trans-2-enoyl-CoA reductase
MIKPGLTIEYPTNTAKSKIGEIERGIKEVPSVKSVVSGDDRGADVGTLSTVIGLLPTVLQSAGALTQTIKQVTDMVRGQSVKGVKMKFSDGTEISIDKGSSEDVQKLIAAMLQK